MFQDKHQITPPPNLPISLSHILRMRTVDVLIDDALPPAAAEPAPKEGLHLLDLLNVLRLQLIVSAVGVRVAALAVGPGAAGSASSSAAAAIEASQASAPAFSVGPGVGRQAPLALQGAKLKVKKNNDEIFCSFSYFFSLPLLEVF